MFATLVNITVYLLFTTINQQSAYTFLSQDEHNISRMHIVAPFSLSELNFTAEYISCNETCITAEMSSVVIPFHFLFMSFFTLLMWISSHSFSLLIKLLSRFLCFGIKF